MWNEEDEEFPEKSSNLLFILYLLTFWIFYTFNPSNPKHPSFILHLEKKTYFIFIQHFIFDFVCCVCVCVYLPLLFVKKIYIIVILSCLSSQSSPKPTFQSPSVPFNFSFDFFTSFSYFTYYYYYYYYYYSGWSGSKETKRQHSNTGH